MKTLFLGAIVLLLPNLLDACNSNTEEYKKCRADCIADHYGRQAPPFPCPECEYLNRYVCFKHLRKPEIFLLLKLLTAPNLEDVYLLKVFSAN